MVRILNGSVLKWLWIAYNVLFKNQKFIKIILNGLGYFQDEPCDKADHLLEIWIKIYGIKMIIQI